MSHSSEDCLSERSDQKSINDGLVVPLGIRAKFVKQYKKFEYKLNKDLKSLRKNIKMLYSIAK